jgi:hypothetical protein
MREEYGRKRQKMVFGDPLVLLVFDGVTGFEVKSVRMDRT